MVLLCEFVLARSRMSGLFLPHDCDVPSTVRLELSFWGLGVSDSYLGVFGGRASAGHRTRAVGGELLVRRTKED